VDAAQYYNRVNHVIISLVWYVLIWNEDPITVLLTCLQTMDFFQYTGFEDLITFPNGDKVDKYLLGFGQGSRGTPTP
jgi:hypothetical protein